MGRYRFNPFTGTLDDVGTGGGGGGGTVTSVAGGVGITGTPDPIVGAGTLDLDLGDLAPETTLAAGDLFPFVDVSEGTDPADQRVVALSDLADAIDALIGPYQPLDAGLTALSSLAAGIAVSDGADGWVPRSIAVTDTATVNLTVTNASGVTGDPTIQADVLAAGISGLGFVDGAGVAGQVAFWADANTVTGDAGLVYDPTLVSGLGALRVEGFVRIGSLTVPTSALEVDGDISILPAPGAGRLFFYEPAASGAHSTRIEAQAQAADISWTLPAAQGAATSLFENDGSGNLSWRTRASLNALLDHGLLLGLADDDHTQYTLRAGRAGTNNDTALTTDNNGTGSLYGGTDDGAILRLVGSSSGSAHTGHIETYLDQLRVRNDLSGTTISTGIDTLPVVLTSGSGTITISHANAVLGFLGTQGTLEYTVNSAVDVTLLRNKWNFVTDTASTRFAGMQCVSNTPSFTAQGVEVAAGNTPHVGLNHLPSYLATGGGTITSTVDYAVRSIFSAGAGVSGGGVSGAGIIHYGHYMLASLTGGATLDNFYGIFIDNFTVGADDCSLVSLGSHRMFHLGYARFGNATFTAAAVSGVQVDVFTGFIRARAGVQVRGGTQVEFWDAANTFHSDFNASASQSADIDYTLPAAAPTADDYAATSTTAGVMSWTKVPVVVAEVSLTGQTANLGPTPIFTTPAADGHYRISGEIIVTTVAGVSSTLPSVTLGFTNGDNATAQAPAVTVTSGGNLLTTRGQFVHNFWANASSNITYTTAGYASNPATTMQYSLRIRLERL